MHAPLGPCLDEKTRCGTCVSSPMHAFVLPKRHSTQQQYTSKGELVQQEQQSRTEDEEVGP